ncbi:mitochondrial ATP-dependent RNA helicase, putative [Babesia ovata]|uniref:Mitochondrial ATP-dependent RNA helicase, putative n=1 Tax=Babesia ovata TaxID=189622 RepID=A0A2H6K6W9_9APIC|nr:mitochondrial ATP-dependent RNA helicase, putative [Babesia ovata]GBE58722.1 mitochondrial ATP-dependent RNA helicase, putative [Babesia ovata]
MRELINASLLEHVGVPVDESLAVLYGTFYQRDVQLLKIISYFSEPVAEHIVLQLLQAASDIPGSVLNDAAQNAEFVLNVFNILCFYVADPIRDFSKATDFLAAKVPLTVG